MIRWIRPSLFAVLGACLCLFGAAPLSCPAATSSPSPEEQKLLAGGKHFERAGWIYLHVQGEPRQRGFQHGYLLAKEIGEGLRTTRAGWEHDTAMDWKYLVTNAATMFLPRIDPENLAELDGIAEGVRAAGVNVTRDDIIAYNAIIELAGYWWPGEFRKLKDTMIPAGRQSCSSFIATGRWTKDANVVLGHNTMQGYADVLPRVIADIAPARGHRILWQSVPGWIHSGTDFFITDAGIVGSETTIGDFDGFDTNGVPEFVRMRRATQDASSLDGWADLMKKGNNGGYANAWLLGNIHTKEIARLELGLKFIGYEKKRDGYFLGSNVAEDTKILRFETTTRETDIRASAIARRVRWQQLMSEHAGAIDVALAKQFEGDHFDTYRNKEFPGGRSLCGHYELDGDAAGQPGFVVPWDAWGTVDGKVVDAAMAKKMSFAARWGSACGKPFLAGDFLAAHPQFDRLAASLKDRPREAWAVFRAGE